MFLETLRLLLDAIDVPALILGMFLVGLWVSMKQAQSRDDFDFGNMLKDESGKESAIRLAQIIALGISSWFLMYDTIHNKQGDPTVLLIYLAVWSGAKVADKLAGALIAKWSK